MVGIDNFHPYYSREIKQDNLEQVNRKAKKSEGEFKFVEGSLLDESKLNKLPEEPEKVFHLAAIAGVRNSVKNSVEYTKNNSYALAKLLDHFVDPEEKRSSLDQFIFASSSSVSMVTLQNRSFLSRKVRN